MKNKRTNNPQLPEQKKNNSFEQSGAPLSVSSTAFVDSGMRSAETPTDLLLSKEIHTVDDLQLQAVTEGFNKSNAYAAARINNITRCNINAATLKIRQEARKKSYSLSQLMHDPDLLMTALDEFDLMCFELGLYPLEHLLAQWLNCTMAEIQALKTSGQSSASGKILRMHADYTVSIISQNALASEKPPVFAMYYLKTAYGMYDIPTEQTININARQLSPVDISTDTLTNNAQIFSTLPGSEGKTGEK